MSIEYQESPYLILDRGLFRRAHIKLWVIGQKVCVTNPNKLENL